MSKKNFTIPENAEFDEDFVPFFLPDDNDSPDKKSENPFILPILPLKDNVLFPGITMPITVQREKAVKLVNEAIAKEMPIGIVSQKDKNKENPEAGDIYDIGCLAVIINADPIEDGKIALVIQGIKRFKITKLVQDEPYFSAEIELLPKISKVNVADNYLTMLSEIKELALICMQNSFSFQSGDIQRFKQIQNNAFLLNFISSVLLSDSHEKQIILEMQDLSEKMKFIREKLENEKSMLELNQQIQSKVTNDLNKQQRQFFLNEQLKKIQEELGNESGIGSDIQELKDKAAKKHWSKDVAQVFEKELNKLQRMNSMMPDYSVQLNYLNTIIDLPWSEYTEDNFDLYHAATVLDRDHFGLEKVKDRIIEYIAVLKLKKDMKSPILCLLGPPGVGKTSLGKSIAEALDRKYIRIALGGLRDESEIRGHRRTYIGAMPGRIIQSLKKVQSSNPVFVLDEIDKVLGMNINGDPSAALLEVLDPEQNTSFHDNYLDVDYDLSKVLFIATANTLSTVHPALKDRMEVVELSGYIIEEKLEIAKRHLIPKLLEEHGLDAKTIEFTDEVIVNIIDAYTRESGVRQLEKQLAKMIRGRARGMVEGKKMSKKFSLEEVKQILGVQIFDSEQSLKKDTVGVVTGLAWTSVGGEILFVEASISQGKGNLTLTGNLGDVMKESAALAYEYVKANAKDFDINTEIFENNNLHIHVPEGAVPKDGPSAGIAMLTAIVSVFTKRKIKANYAMTGEITLRGQVLPIGGVKEKLLAAKRAKISNIILCAENKRNVDEIPANYLKGVKFHYVDTMKEVIELALK